MSKGINLLTTNISHSKKTSSVKGVQPLRLLAGFFIFFVSGAAIVHYILVALSPLPQLQQEEAQALTTLSQTHPDIGKLTYLQDRYAGITTILNARNTYDAVLRALLIKLPPGVTIAHITMNKKNVTLTAQSTSLLSLNQFVGQIVASANAKQAYSNVILNGVTNDNQSNLFSLTVTFTLLKQ